MQFEPHGEFELSLVGEIFIMTFLYEWNLEGAKAFFSKYKAFVEQKNIRKFGVLSDLRKFEGGTPDGIDFFEEISDWAQANGQIARALLLDSRLVQYTVNQADKGKNRFPVRVFPDKEEAFVWFQSLGLSVS